MEFTLSIALPEVGTSPVDIDVCAPIGATAGELAALLASEFGVAAGRLSSGTGPVPEDALVGHPPLLHGASLSLATGQPRREPARHRPSPLELAVVAGPDCGRRFPLEPGRHLLGRGAGAGLRVDDPSLSRSHAVLSVGPDGVHVADAGSTNGMHVDGAQIPTRGSMLNPGQMLRVGHSLVQVRSPGVRPAAVEPDGRGFRLVNRAPRVPTTPEPVTITLPTRPEPRRSARFPWLAMLVPLPVCAVLAVLMGPQLLLFALMTPVMMLGNALSDRVTGRREYAGQLAEFERATTRAADSIVELCRHEVALRRSGFPDAVTILQTATTPGSRLWERSRRDPDVLTIRIGTGSVPSSLRVVDPSAGHASSVPSLHDAPVVADLDLLRVLGLAGHQGPVAAMLRSIVGQIAALHSPRDVRLVALASGDGDAAEFAWLRLLPHCEAVASPADEARFSSVVSMVRPTGGDASHSPLQPVTDEEGSAVWGGARTVVLLLGSRELRARPGIASLLSDGLRDGLRIIAVDRDPASLPLECRAVIEVDEAGVTARMESSTLEGPLAFTPDGCRTSWAEQAARSLASLRDNTPADAVAALPDLVRLADLHGASVFDAEWIARQWVSSTPSTVAALGLALGGAFTVDLVRDGPHVLVGGTTGSGKSELLQTVVVSLALANRPEELGLVLVDYKGGSAFSKCGQLPHTVGIVTDLDGHLAQRALASLRAELSRRERLLATVGATDLDDYRAKAAAEPRTHVETLGRLVLVIDEFKALAEELPEFLEGVVRLAAVGRSLGVHLVLATQRPGGIVSADIRANVNLRIALRVRDRVDSEDVIEAPDAAGLQERHRGRALARSGGGRLTTFQTAWLGARDYTAEKAVLSIRRRGSTIGTPVSQPSLRRSSDHAQRREPTDLDRVVEALHVAAQLVGCSSPPRPWLPPLPDVLPLSHLAPPPAPDHEGSPDHESSPGRRPSPGGPGASSTPQAPWGLADDPAGQRQPLFSWYAQAGPGGGGHWVIGGSGGSGRTSALRTLAFTAARSCRPDHLHLYAIDGSSNALRAIERFPHTGAVVPRADFARVVRLVNRLAREVRHRQQRLTTVGHASLDEWRAAGDAHVGSPAGPPAYLLLLVDDWDLLARDSEHQDHGETIERLASLLREGEQVGLRAVVTGDRSVLIGRSTSWATHRLLLRLADPSDAALVGLARERIPRHQPPGRGIVAGGLEVQLAHLGSTPDAAAAAQAISDLAAALPSPGANPPFAVATMPTDVLATQLARTGRGLEFALGGEECTTVALDFERHGRQILITGPGRSGKSTALGAFAVAAREHALPVAWVAPTGRARGSTPVAGRTVQVIEEGDAARLAALCREQRDLVVLVDDADQLLDTPVETVLREFCRTVDRTGGAIICAANSVALASQYRGVAVEVGRHQTGLLLNPRSVADGDLLGIRVPRGLPGSPGRGLLACRGEVLEVQVARPPTEPEPSQSEPSRPQASGKCASALDVGELLADLAIAESQHVDTTHMAG